MNKLEKLLSTNILILGILLNYLIYFIFYTKVHFLFFGTVIIFTFILLLITNFKNNKQIIIRNPSAVRPWQHVLDIVNAILLSINYKKKFDKNANIFNLAPNNKSHINVLTFLKYVKKFLKKKKLKYKYKKIKFYESRVLKLSNKLAKKELKWAPKLNIEDSIKLTTTWYESILKNKKKNYTITIEQINKYFGLRNNL